MGKGVRGERGGERREATATMETNCVLIRVSHRVVEEPERNMKSVL